VPSRDPGRAGAANLSAPKNPDDWLSGSYSREYPRPVGERSDDIPGGSSCATDPPLCRTATHHSEMRSSSSKENSAALNSVKGHIDQCSRARWRICLLRPRCGPSLALGRFHHRE
jgi:hypothetical protein